MVILGCFCKDRLDKIDQNAFNKLKLEFLIKNPSRVLALLRYGSIAWAKCQIDLAIIYCFQYEAIKAPQAPTPLVKKLYKSERVDG